MKEYTSRTEAQKRYNKRRHAQIAKMLKDWKSQCGADTPQLTRNNSERFDDTDASFTNEPDGNFGD